MIVLNPYLVLAAIAAVYILVFGGLSLLRREGLSNQFALEVIGLTAIAMLVSQVAPVILNPVLFSGHCLRRVNALAAIGGHRQSPVHPR